MRLTRKTQGGGSGPGPRILNNTSPHFFTTGVGPRGLCCLCQKEPLPVKVISIHAKNGLSLWDADLCRGCAERLLVLMEAMELFEGAREVQQEDENEMSY